MSEQPVLIVGAGPVGMTAALELARFDVPSVILDRKPHLERQGSRAIVLARHTLETFQRLGCGGPVLEKAVALTRARTYFRSTELFCVEFPPVDERELPPFVNLQQTYTERALFDRIRASPQVDVLWETEVTGVAQGDGGVRLAVRRPEGESELAGAYVVGCDGAGSTLRKQLGVDFPGRTFDDRFLIADIKAELPFPNERRFFFDPPWNPGRQVLIHPQPDGEWRIDWQVPADTDAEAERASGKLDRRIRAIVGDASYELAWLTAYRFHSRLAARFRVGRAFLAGDAAHLMAPFGARGLNSGVEDASNLAWKLALVRAGEAPDSLLDTYETERRAAARENLRVTSATMRFMAPPTRLQRLLRNAILRGSLHSRRVRRLVDSGKLATPAVYARPTEGGLVGRPAPAGRLRGELGDGFTGVLFCSGCDGERRVAREVEAVAKPLRLLTVPRKIDGPAPAGVTRVADDGALARDYGVDGSEAFYLVRPDGYVAAELREPDRREIGAALRSALRAG